MTRILILVAIGLAVLAAIVGLGGMGSVGDSDWSRILVLGIIAASTGSWLIASQKNLPTALRNLMIWILIGLGLMGVWLIGQDPGNWAGRMVAALKPGTAATTTNAEGNSVVLLYKSADGHYHADVTVNGVVIPMLVDTGATGIALTWEDARAAGFNPATLNFDKTVMTANGQAKSASVKLSSVSVGKITRSNIDAGVAEQGRLGRSLLGMNFLETLSAVTMSGQELRLQD